VIGFDRSILSDSASISKRMTPKRPVGTSCGFVRPAA